MSKREKWIQSKLIVHSTPSPVVFWKRDDRSCMSTLNVDSKGIEYVFTYGESWIKSSKETPPEKVWQLTDAWMKCVSTDMWICVHICNCTMCMMLGSTRETIGPDDNRWGILEKMMGDLQFERVLLVGEEGEGDKDV